MAASCEPSSRPGLGRSDPDRRFAAWGLAAGALLALMCLCPASAAAKPELHAVAGSPTQLELGIADYGQYGPVDVTHLLRAAKGLNFSIVRLTMEWSPGQTQLSANQKAIVKLTKSYRGITIIYTLSFARGRDAPITKRGRREFIAWAKSLVADGALDVEATNEPMEPLFWSTLDPAKEYADLLLRLYPALHRESRAVTVIAGSLARHHADGFMSQLTKDIAGRKVADAVSLHYPTSTRDYDHRVDLLHKCFGAHLPVYVTEDGSNLRDGAGQADQMANKIGLAWRENAAVWVLLQLQDRPDLLPWHTGLFENDWARKPTYYAIARTEAVMSQMGRVRLTTVRLSDCSLSCRPCTTQPRGCSTGRGGLR